MVAAFALVNLAELMLATKDAMMHLLPPTFLVALLFILLDCGACNIYTYIMVYNEAGRQESHRLLSYR